MAKTKSRAQDRTVNKVSCYLSLIGAIAFLVIGGLALWAHNFTINMVQTNLASQKIYFPAKGSPALDPKTYPDLQKYAGQLVDTPSEAKAFADGYIGRHLTHVADGKVYAEISAESLKDPTNQTLRQQKQTLFEGETLRGILLISGYGFGTIGNIAGIAAIFAFVLSGGLLLLTLSLKRRFN
jgi:hypothetical protein